MREQFSTETPSLSPEVALPGSSLQTNFFSLLSAALRPRNTYTVAYTIGSCLFTGKAMAIGNPSLASRCSICLRDTAQ